MRLGIMMVDNPFDGVCESTTKTCPRFAAACEEAITNR
jgi:hypothetical protein